MNIPLPQPQNPGPSTPLTSSSAAPSTSQMAATASTSAANTSGPQMRSRITVVCGECKRLKLKCDRRNPCGSCIKRDTVARCIYSPAAAEKVDLHSLNNRLIQVETTLTQITSGISPPPFVSSYPPSSSGSSLQFGASSSSPTQSLSTAKPTYSSSSSAPGPSNVNKQVPTCNPPTPTTQIPPYHSIFSPLTKGDMSAMTIPLAVIFDTFLAGAFRLHSPGDMGEEEFALLQQLGFDLSPFPSPAGKGKAPLKGNSLPSGKPYNVLGVGFHKDAASVKLEPTPVSLQLQSGTRSNAVPLTSNMTSGTTSPAANLNSRGSHATTSFPFDPQITSDGWPGLNVEQESPLHDEHRFPPISAYRLSSSLPQSRHEYVFSSSLQNNASQSCTPTSQLGVTPTLLSYLPNNWDEMKTLLTAVEQYECSIGVNEDWGHLEQRIRSMLDGSPSADGQLPGLSFFASVCALLALGGELRHQWGKEHHAGDDSQMVVDDQHQQSNTGKINVVHGEGEKESRQWRKNPNFISHKCFGTSTHTMSSALQPASTISNPAGTVNMSSASEQAKRIMDSVFLYDLSVQALSMTDLELHGQPADMDYVQACLWQVKYLFTRARGTEAAGKGLGSFALPLVGKMVNVARQIELGKDPDDEVDPYGESSSSHQPHDPSSPENTTKDDTVRHNAEKEAEKNRRRRIWWEVVYYDLFISDAMNHPPLVATAHIPTPSSSAQGPTSPLHEYLSDRQVDPASLFYESVTQYTTQLPRPAGNATDVMSVFELRCRLAQLVKLVQARVTNSRGYSYEQAASYEAELRTTLEMFKEEWRYDRHDVEDHSEGAIMDPGGAGHDGGSCTAGRLRDTAPPSDLLKAETAVIINRLAIKLYLPFVRPQSPSTVDMHEFSRTRPVLHQAIYGLVNAAHNLLDAARTLVPSLDCDSSCPDLPQGAFDFYNFGRMVFDATVICAHAQATQPTAMWAPQAKEDVVVGAEVIGMDAMKASWCRGIEFASSYKERYGPLTWADANHIVTVLKKKVNAIHGAAVTRAGTITKSVVCVGSKRKFSEAQTGLGDEEDEENRRAEGDARYPSHQFDPSLVSSSVPNAHSIDSEPSASCSMVSEPASNVTTYLPAETTLQTNDPALSDRNEPRTLVSSAALPPNIRPRRLSTSTTSSVSTSLTSSTGFTQNSHDLQRREGCNQKDRMSRKDKDKMKHAKRSPMPGVGVRIREAGTPFPKESTPMPRTFRNKERRPLSQPEPNPSPSVLPLTDDASPRNLVDSRSGHSSQKVDIRPADQMLTHQSTTTAVYRSRSSSIIQDSGQPHPTSQQQVDSSVRYAMPYSDIGTSHARRPSVHDYISTPQELQMTSPHTLYDPSQTSYDSPHSYDHPRGSVDHGRAGSYGPASSPYGATTTSSGPLSTASSPYTHTSGQSLPTPSFGPSPHHPSPPSYESGNAPLASTGSAAYYMPPNSNTNPPYEAQYEAEHMQQGDPSIAYNVQGLYTKAGNSAPYELKPTMENLPSASQVHDISMQEPQHRQFAQHQLPQSMPLEHPQQSWSPNAVQNHIDVHQQQSNNYWHNEYKYFG